MVLVKVFTFLSEAPIIVFLPYAQRGDTTVQLGYAHIVGQSDAAECVSRLLETGSISYSLCCVLSRGCRLLQARELMARLVRLQHINMSHESKIRRRGPNVNLNSAFRCCIAKLIILEGLL